MGEAQRAIDRATALHKTMKENVQAFGTLLVDGFHLLALFAIGATTVWAAVAEFLRLVIQGHAGIADILLLFIYMEIGAMVGIYFKTTRLPVRYLIYIAITALARILVEIVGAEHQTGMDLLYVTGSILLLALAVLILRYGSYKLPSDIREADIARGVAKADPETDI